MKKKYRVALLVGLGALALPLFAATAAQASTTYSCVFTGAAGPITPSNTGPLSNPGINRDEGLESILTDLNQNESTVATDNPLLDTDNGSSASLGTYVDGTYSFATAPLSVNPPVPNPSYCLVYSDGDIVDQSVTLPEAGVYPIDISAGGGYDNQLVGTGDANGSADVNFFTDLAHTNGTNAAADGPVHITYTILFNAAQGVLTVTGGNNANGSGATGNGGVTIEPTDGDNNPNNDLGPTTVGPPVYVRDPGAPNTNEPGINGDVTEFRASGVVVVAIP